MDAFPVECLRRFVLCDSIFTHVFDIITKHSPALLTTLSNAGLLVLSAHPALWWPNFWHSLFPPHRMLFLGPLPDWLLIIFQISAWRVSPLRGLSWSPWCKEPIYIHIPTPSHFLSHNALSFLLSKWFWFSIYLFIFLFSIFLQLFGSFAIIARVPTTASVVQYAKYAYMWIKYLRLS